MTGAESSTARAGASEGAQSVEVELKFDVTDTVALPDWTGIPGVESIDEAEVRELDAVYFDTAEFALAGAGFAVRRRTGGSDEGWHVKGPRVGRSRVEVQWPLGEDPGVPEGVMAAIAPVSDGALHEIARIRNTRTAYGLRDRAGGLVAEFVDDRVIATDVRSGVQRSWREWEFELGPAAPEDDTAIFDAASAAVAAVGAQPAASSSKLARALGY